MIEETEIFIFSKKNKYTKKEEYGIKRHQPKRKRSLARLLLFVEGGISLTVLMFFLMEYAKESSIDPLYANSYYPAIAEYVIASLVIPLATAVLVDRLENENRDAS